MVHPKHILVVSCLVRNLRNQLLLVKHHQRGWELPQGRVEEGESLEAALHREVLEETGIRICAPQTAAIWSKLSPPAAVIFCFTARYAAGELQPSDETPEVIWAEEDQAREIVVHPVNRDRLHLLLQQHADIQLCSYVTGPYRTIS